MKAKTIRITAACTAPPERVLAAAYDFSERRPDIWPNVPADLMTVHELGTTSADVTEGTRMGPLHAWERCHYDWSTPGSVTATVTDSNVYATPDSSWAIRAIPSGTGSTVEMIWVRTFQRNALGRFLGTLYRLGGARLFRGDVERTLRNIERIEAGSRA